MSKSQAQCVWVKLRYHDENKRLGKKQRNTAFSQC